MSEEKNIPDEKSEDQKSSPAGRAGKSERVTAALEDSSIQHSASNIQHVKEMEVHKHPHHVSHKKRWPEYLLEFLMLFLAVFLGFIAENIREQSVERHREKEYMQSMIEDLAQDTLEVNRVSLVNVAAIGNLDTLMDLLKLPLSGDTATRKKLY